jgi:hypothetical protein
MAMFKMFLWKLIKKNRQGLPAGKTLTMKRLKYIKFVWCQSLNPCPM